MLKIKDVQFLINLEKIILERLKIFRNYINKKRSNIKYINKDLIIHRERQLIYNKIFNSKNKKDGVSYNIDLYNKLKEDADWLVKFKIYSKINREHNKKAIIPLIDNNIEEIPKL